MSGPSWQHHPGQPVPGGQPPNPWQAYWAQQQGPQPGGPSFPGGPPPIKRGIPLWVKIGVPVVLVALVAAVVVVAATRGGAEDGENTADVGSGSPTDPSRWGIGWPAGPVRQHPVNVAGLPSAAGIPADALRRAGPRALLFAMLKRQSTRPVTDYVSLDYQTPYDYRTNFQGGSVRRVAIDYRSREFFTESSDVDPDGSPSETGSVYLRCVNGASHVYSPDRRVWRPPSGADSMCSERMKPGKVVANSFTSDGIAAGGLSGADADKFISYLDGIDGLLTVRPPQQVRDDGGKPYIQLDVTLNQLDPRDARNIEKIATGMGFLQAAFAQTGKDAHDYPYSIDLGASEGRRMRYYLDPATLLPAYSVMMSVRPRYIDGRPTGDERFENAYHLFQYSFPDRLDPDSLRAGGTPRMPYQPWPFEQTVFR